jgi:hypothetical protein
MTPDLVLRDARPSERAQLEALQRRASLALDEYRNQLLAHPDAIALPAEQIAAGQVIVAEARGRLVGFAAWVSHADGAELDGHGQGRRVFACHRRAVRGGLLPALRLRAVGRQLNPFRACAADDASIAGVVTAS